MEPLGQPDPDPDCPFCNIAGAFPPVSPLHIHPSSPTSPRVCFQSPPLTTTPTSPSAAHYTSDPWDVNKTFPPAFVVLSTPEVVAFLDIAPLTRGHLLVASRGHRVRIGDLGTGEGAEIGRWLPVLSRAVVKTVLGTEHTEADWNVVQNNGPRAAQVIPHVHFHIIPRPADPISGSSGLPTLRQQSYTMFGRGQRDELDEDEAEELAREIRGQVRVEVERVREGEGVDLTSGWDGKEKGDDRGGRERSGNGRGRL